MGFVPSAPWLPRPVSSESDFARPAPDRSRAATRELGFRTLHKGGSSSSQVVLDAERAGRPLLDGFAPGFAAFFDVEALVHRFVELDAAYPGSRFILSTRDEDAWLSSMERHALANQERKAARGVPR